MNRAVGIAALARAAQIGMFLLPQLRERLHACGTDADHLEAERAAHAALFAALARVTQRPFNIDELGPVAMFPKPWSGSTHVDIDGRLDHANEAG